MPTVSHRNLVDLPKAHLHIHLEGAMRLATLRELSVRYEVPAPEIGPRFATFAEFQALYVAARGVLRTDRDVALLVGEVVEDAARDGAVWIEIAIHPTGNRGLGSRAHEMSSLIAAGAEASKVTGVGVGWVVTADRTRSSVEATELAYLAADFSDQGVVAFGLANDEAAAPPEVFEKAFAIAREARLLSAPHAGEHGGPASVLSAVDVLNADRIQHGVRAFEDVDLVARLARDQICLDVCPTSNVVLSVVPTIDEHPLPHLLAAGVPCTINADDPLLFGAGLLDEYELCRHQLGFDDTTLANCARSSIEYSGAPRDLKAAAMRAIASWCKRV
jgi:adenosine deaminase